MAVHVGYVLWTTCNCTKTVKKKLTHNTECINFKLWRNCAVLLQNETITLIPTQALPMTLTLTLFPFHNLPESFFRAYLLAPPAASGAAAEAGGTGTNRSHRPT